MSWLKFEGVDWNMDWVGSLKSLDIFLKTTSAQHNYLRMVEEERIKLLTKIYEIANPPKEESPKEERPKEEKKKKGKSE